MESTPFLSRSKSSSLSSLLPPKSDDRLSLPMHRHPRIRVRTLLGHCLYRRVLIWAVTFLFLLFLTLFGSGVHTQHGKILDLMDFRKVSQEDGEAEAVGAGEISEEDDGEVEPHWLKYPHLDGYFNGLKVLVPFSRYTPEYPRLPENTHHGHITATMNDRIPMPTPFIPHPDYSSPEYTEKYYPVQECFLDEDKKIPVPDLYAYNGVIQGQAKAVMGSYDVLGLREDICFDRFGRFGPYGLGYGMDAGGVQEGMDTESVGSDAVWSKTGRINYSNIDWGAAQDQCLEANKRRFVENLDNPEDELEFPPPRFTQQVGDSRHEAPQPLQHRRKKLERIAVVVRSYVGFQWTQHAILNFRAMVSELSLRSGGEYTVHFLLHVRDNSAPVWADPETAQRLLDDNVPAEFHGLCTLWSEAQMRLLYPGPFGPSLENPSNADVHGVYRSAHMALQHFVISHPEYAHVWNWEMDMRWLGSYYELFDRAASWAARQSRVLLWERSQKYYVPALHGSWADFADLVANETDAAGRHPVLGPVIFPGKQPLRDEARPGAASILPASCARGSGGDAGAGANDPARCGAGEAADLITLNPLFDAEDSGWVFAGDVTGYEPTYAPPPRRCAIVTASRLSRRLLLAMHEETWRLRHSMFSEMFPASVALHRGLKAAFAPHPVYLDRRWEPLVEVERAFNGGEAGGTGGKGSPFDLRNEHNHRGTSWYYNSEFAGLLWRRWLGYAQMDGRGEGGGRSGEGTLRGGREEEQGRDGTGRMCLRSMLVHPIKWEKPSERD